MATAAAIAESLHARRVGPGRWMAQCPGHADRAPSLRIGEGRDGRVLLHCFAGCRLADILRSAGIPMQQLWGNGPARPVSPAAAQANATERAEQAARRRAERRRTERLRLQWLEYEHTARALAYKLTKLPESSTAGDVLAACFHDVLAEQRSIDRMLTGDNEWD